MAALTEQEPQPSKFLILRFIDLEGAAAVGKMRLTDVADAKQISLSKRLVFAMLRYVAN